MARGFFLPLYELKKPKMSHAGSATGLSDQVSGIISPNVMLGILKFKLNYINVKPWRSCWSRWVLSAKPSSATLTIDSNKNMFSGKSSLKSWTPAE